MRMHLFRRGPACAAPLVALAAAAVPATAPSPTDIGSAPHAQQSREGGSRVPCAVPLEWRLARVDPAFGVSERDVVAALEEAAALWEGAVGRDLFRQAPRGFPIRLVFDDRQADAQERAEQSAAAARDVARLEAERMDLEARTERHQASAAAYAERQRTLERRVSEHNARVRGWNERGDATADMLEELRLAGAALEVDHAALNASRDALAADLALLRRDEARLADRVEEHNQRVRRVDPTAGSEPVESGVYRESVRMASGRVESVSREIRIFRFASERELVLVAAHEMGHALGLGHAAGSDALMSEAHRGDRAAGMSTLPRPDLDRLRDVCPDLVP
ncbi:MAG: matrixin family metalloprotease [Gemmatimonadota bacterium]